MSEAPRTQRIRDPVHGLIVFREDKPLDQLAWRLLDAPEFQRLRRIRQLGVSEFVFPSATHTRFAHSVGVFHTARSLIEIIKREISGIGQIFNPKRAEVAVVAALLHDLGHGPFSHAFEKIGERFNLKMANHEAVSDMLIRDGEVFEELREMGSGFANDVADMVSGSGTPTIYSAVVSSQFDADRLDYMRRDRLMTGSQHAGIDFE